MPVNVVRVSKGEADVLKRESEREGGRGVDIIIILVCPVRCLKCKQSIQN